MFAGVVLNSRKRIQVNVPMKKNKYLSYLTNLYADAVSKHSSNFTNCNIHLEKL